MQVQDSNLEEILYVSQRGLILNKQTNKQTKKDFMILAYKGLLSSEKMKIVTRLVITIHLLRILVSQKTY